MSTLASFFENPFILSMYSMRKIILFTLVIAVALPLVQCKSKKKAMSEAQNTEMKASTSSATSEQAAVKPEPVKPIKVFANYVQEPSDPFTLMGLRVSGDTLFAQVRYGGGCQEHEFSMHTTGAWMKSMPPQLMLYLDHKANNDNCRALITKEIAFDFSKTKYPGSKQMKFVVNDDREKAIVVSYE